ncbi:hypothetical protein [Magnetospira sp. QH-2]|uniref:TolB family protein n=1 Tax=Magnetospira sp. (strain QH-2) TaxID=1288970 RepID=UPI0011DCCC05|nr:hypothetical protein [Magnetospira sp. QH-2]
MAVIAGCVAMVLFPTHAMAAERYVLSSGGSIGIYELRDENLVEVMTLVWGVGWHGPSHPVFRRSKNTFFFDASRRDGRGSQIFEAPLQPDAKDHAKPIVQGQAPSLSPDETQLAYVTQSNDLMILDLNSQKSRLIDVQVRYFTSPLWLDSHRLLYRLNISHNEEDRNPEKDLVLFDFATGTRRLLEPRALYPIARTSKGQVICGDYFARSLSLLDLETSTLQELFRSKLFKVGPIPILRPNNQGFLYARQNWKNWRRLLPEAQSIYVRDWQGNETLVRDNNILVGGFFLGEK